MKTINGTDLYSELENNGIECSCLPSMLYDALSKKNITLGTAESCTGGLVCAAMAGIPGVSGILLGGICSYSNDIKEKLLGVSHSTLESFGAVSDETAVEMAVGAQQALGVRLAISTTGIAGPGGGTDKKPVGLVYIGIALDDKVFSVRGEFWDLQNPDRENIRKAAVDAGIYLALKEINSN